MIPLQLITAYLLGTIPTGLLVVRLVRGIDLRATGSGNIGATNVVRTAGWGWGLTTLAIDALKGALVPVWMAQAPLPHLVSWQIAAGILALAGNVFNPFLGFKGGKGVGTAMGIMAAIAPLPASAGFMAFLAGFLSTRIVSVGSLSAGAVFGVSALVHYFWSETRPTPLWLAFCLIVSVLVFVTHRANLRRLLAGTETRLTRQK